jgi:putative transcriptional regulator
MVSNLRAKRQAAGITHKDLADRVGVTRQTIILIEACKYNPDMKISLLLAHQTGCTVDALFHFKEKDKEK